MLSYEICKQLKEAGFPQKNGKSHEAYYLNAGEITGIIDYDMYSQVEDSFRSAKITYIPTLSELIEACGDEFTSLEHSHIYNDLEDYWEYSCYSEKVGMTDGSYRPEETVAKLYLEINKK